MINIFSFMGFYNFLENLREKPEAYRRRILFVSVFIVMLFVAGLWAFTFSLSSEKKSANLSSAAAPFSFIRQNMRDGFTDIKYLFQQTFIEEEVYQNSNQ